MGKLWKKIPIMIKIKAVLLFMLVVGVVFLLDYVITGNIVASKYLVASSESPRLNRTAFIYNYTVRSGDDTLALLTGVDTSVAPVGGMVLSTHTVDDLRPLVKIIATAFIEQGSDSDYVNTGKAKAIEYLRNPVEEGSSLSIAAGSLKLYNKYDSQEYTIAVSGTSNNYTSVYRCCCCFSEVMAQLLTGTKFPVSTVHTRGMGLAVEPPSTRGALPTSTESGAVLVNGRYIQSPLSSIWSSGSAPKVKDLVESGDLKAGSIILYSTDNSGKTSVHVDMVVYVDKTARKVYIAGAGQDGPILKDAMWGWNSCKSYDDNTTIETFNSTDHYIVNILHYTQCYNVTGGE